MSRKPFDTLLIVGLASTLASAWCWKTVPETPYVPHIEEQPCDVGAQGNCFVDYYVCQQGTVCAKTPLGVQSCTNVMANRPVRVYNGGFVNSFGCCVGGTAYYQGMDPLVTCPTPMGMLGTIGCIFWEPAPE